VTRRHIRVDGEQVELPADLGCTLASVLRSAGHTGVKVACGRGECGACTVQIDGVPVMACTTLAATVTGEVTTARRIAQTSPDLAEAFADQVAFQCGFCTPGQMVRADAVLRECPSGRRDEVAKAMVGNVCRCTGYAQIVDAVCHVAHGRRTRKEAP
jgi:aerobic-type carbon monoxide dehydrogenase small subunit (CoxS/CutS family)